MRQYYIKGNYYFDIDENNQLRISGPGNHLFAGISFPQGVTIQIEDFFLKGEKLFIDLVTNTKNLRTNKPVISDIRTVRNYIEGSREVVTFKDLVQKGIDEVIPQEIKKKEGKYHRRFCYLNIYLNEFAEERFYGTCVIVSREFRTIFSKKSISIKGNKNIKFRISTRTNIQSTDRIEFKIFKGEAFDQSLLSEFLISLYEESKRNIEFLIRGRRTSSFEYGTIFPRDWIESADLGVDDLTQETIDYMYKQSMLNVSEEGEGWHEIAVGQYRTKVKDPESVIDRKMIDIEPHYILGLRFLSPAFLTNENNREILNRVADFVLKMAREHSLITFKPIKGQEDDYYKVGNWRDSEQAYPSQRIPLAPYDVNCVFYPQCLLEIREHSDYFEITDIEEIQNLIDKWNKNKDKFRMYHPDDLIGYSLALHGQKHKPLPTPHLDESYDMFYGDPSLEEVISFAIKLIDSDYFFTPGGPILVAADEDDFDTTQYHGKVIWPKQSAYCTAGLVRQIKRGLSESWGVDILQILKESVIKTCEASFKGWQDIGYVPELYYFNKQENKSKPYTAQEEYEGQMSSIQLWSSVGARRMIRDYIFAKNLTF